MLPGLENPSLRKLHQDAVQIGEAFAALVRGLSPAQLRWRPHPSAWGIAHCLEHLVATGRAYEPELERALVRAGRTRSAAPLSPGPVGRWLIAAAGPGSRERRLACPRVLAPAAAPKDGALERFLAGQRRLLGFLEEADGVDINAALVRTPSSRLLRVSLGEAFALANGHAQRHLEQARRVRLHPRFPATG